jgi:rhodanese-related sulfurtransferase
MLQQILQFITHHWMLFLALVLTLALIFWEESKNKVGGTRLSLLDVTNLINRQHAVLLDLRDEAAFQSGHIVNAQHFPHSMIMTQLDKLKKYQNKPIILIDKIDQQAVLVGNKLRAQGFNKVYCLAGGLQTWTNAGLPLVK